MTSRERGEPVDLTKSYAGEVDKNRGYLFVLRDKHDRHLEVLEREFNARMALEAGGEWREKRELVRFVRGVAGPLTEIFVEQMNQPHKQGSWREMSPESAQDLERAIDKLGGGLDGYKGEMELLTRLIDAKSEDRFHEIGAAFAQLADEKYLQGKLILYLGVGSAYRNDLQLGEMGMTVIEPDLRLYERADLPELGKGMDEIFAELAKMHPQDRPRSPQGRWVNLLGQAGWLMSMTTGEAGYNGRFWTVLNIWKEAQLAAKIMRELGREGKTYQIKLGCRKVLGGHEAAHTYYWDEQNNPYDKDAWEEIFADAAAVLVYLRTEEQLELVWPVLLASYLSYTDIRPLQELGEESYKYAISANWMVNNVVEAMERENGLEWLKIKLEQTVRKLWNRDEGIREELGRVQLSPEAREWRDKVVE